MFLAKIARSWLAAIPWLVVTYVAYGALKYHSYLRQFEATQEREPLNSVVTRLGSPTRIYGLYDVPGQAGRVMSICGDDCVLRLEYDLPFTLGIETLAVDFDHQHKVIHKGRMTSA